MADTRQTYCHLLTQLVIFLLRISGPNSQYDLALPDSLSNALDVLHEELDSPSPSLSDEDYDDALLTALVELWACRYRSAGRHQFNDPTIRFIMHTQVNSDLSLKDPHHVTGILAKLTYCMVCLLVSLSVLC